MIGLIITPIVSLSVWSTVAETNGGIIDGFTREALAAYFITIMVVNQLTYTWVMWEYDNSIRQGLLSPRLLRPFHPIHQDIAENIAYKLLTSFVMAPITIGLILAFQPDFSLNTQQIVLFLPALVMGFLIQFLFGWTVAIMSFWTNRVSAVNRIYFFGKLFLAGQLAPLSLLPPALETAASYTPYRWMIAFPSELLLGWETGAMVWQGLLIQLFWVIVLVVVSQLIWRAGIKKYSAVGA
ncbi:MAG: ABC-2 family transporter protein [Chloroflexota bacterium]